LSSSLSVVVLHYYFGPTKLFSDLRLVLNFRYFSKNFFLCGLGYFVSNDTWERIFANIISTM